MYSHALLFPGACMLVHAVHAPKYFATYMYVHVYDCVRDMCGSPLTPNITNRASHFCFLPHSLPHFFLFPLPFLLPPPSPFLLPLPPPPPPQTHLRRWTEVVVSSAVQPQRRGEDVTVCLLIMDMFHMLPASTFRLFDQLMLLTLKGEKALGLEVGRAWGGRGSAAILCISSPTLVLFKLWHNECSVCTCTCEYKYTCICAQRCTCPCL